MRFWVIALFALLVISLFLAFPFQNPFVIKDTIKTKIEPGNWINESNIEIKPDRIILRISNASISRYSNTSSMRPLLDENANGIEIIPSSPADIHVGDIVTYEQDRMLIVHRVISIGNDAIGKYFVVKGDNTEEPDGKIRFEQIKYVLIGVLY